MRRNESHGYLDAATLALYQHYSRRAALVSSLGALIALGTIGVAVWQLQSIKDQKEHALTEMAAAEATRAVAIDEAKSIQARLVSLRQELRAAETQLVTARAENTAYQSVLEGTDPANLGGNGGPPSFKDLAAVAIKPRAAATPFSQEGSSEKLFEFKMWLEFPDDTELAPALKQRIESVRYILNHPSFPASQREIISSTPQDNFAVSYSGWGALDQVIIEIVMTDGEIVQKDFNMLAALGWAKTAR